MDALSAINPLDGRYHKTLAPLAGIWSEAGLIKARLCVEIAYLKALADDPNIPLRHFTEAEKQMLETFQNLNEKQAKKIKEIELTTRHDVKALEYYLQTLLADSTLDDAIPWLHIALTSEDVNNLAYALMLSETLQKVILPAWADVISQLRKLAGEWADIPMLARTHGQAASPTTLGKEMAVFGCRLERQYRRLQSQVILAKCAGASGNYNAQYLIEDIDWSEWARKFICSFSEHNKLINVQHNVLTTQIEPHDSLVEIGQNISLFNTILVDCNRDIWQYISDGWLRQSFIVGMVGSSTMPHKVNRSLFCM